MTDQHGQQASILLNWKILKVLGRKVPSVVVKEIYKGMQGLSPTTRGATETRKFVNASVETFHENSFCELKLLLLHRG